MKSALIASIVAAAAGSATASITLTDGDANTTFDGIAGSAGFTQVEWNVAGSNQLSEQSFGILVNGQFTFLHDLAPAVSFTTDTNGDMQDDTFFVGYDFMGLTIDITYTLTGGAPGSLFSTLAEVIDISAAGNSTPVSFQFFEFANFDLGGTAIDSFIEVLTPGNTVRQGDEGGTVFASETVQTPEADYVLIGLEPDVRGALTAGNLGAFGDPNALPSTFADGDLAWAFGWDVTIQPSGVDSTWQLSKIKQVIPTPGTAGLIAMAGLAGIRRRR